MTDFEKTISLILKDLTNVHENMRSLSEDIWDSIDHTDSETVKKGSDFTIKFNDLLKLFENNKKDITNLIIQYSGVTIEERPKIVNKEDVENQRIIKELNQSEPHEITEDFTYKRPAAFIFNGCAYSEMNNWRDLYIQFLECVAKLNPSKLKEMADNKKFFSTQSKRYYSSENKGLNRPAKIMNDFFVDTNFSANNIAKHIIEILNHIGMKTSDITIYLRQDRNA